MKILLTGASGLVGAAVARQAAQAGHSVIGLTGRWSGAVPGTTGLHSVDLTDSTTAISWIERTKPDAVINAAAVSEPAACEVDPARSQVLNVTLPALLAQATAKSGARFIHISSEQVFSGEEAPYTITCPPRPLNLYGRQKVESEKRIAAANPAAAIVRAPLLLGNSLSGSRSVHEKLFELWAGGGVARLYADEFRQACTAGSLAAALLELAEKPELRGTFHWAGAHLCSRYEIGQRLANHFRVPERFVAPVHRVDTPAISAKRPANLALDLAPLNRALHVKPQSFEAALQELVVPENFLRWQESLQ